MIDSTLQISLVVFMKKLFLGFLLIFLFSCMAMPQIQLKSGGDMAMEIKAEVPRVTSVAVSSDGDNILAGYWGR